MSVSSLEKSDSRFELTDVKRGQSVSAAYRFLQQLIVEGQIAPGSWVVEGELAARLGMSRTPIRGAVQLLQREGMLIEHKGEMKSRYRAPALTHENAVELYLLIGNLEGLAASQAAALPEQARARLVRTMTVINEKLAKIGKAKNVELRSVFQLDEDFHFTIVDACAGSMLRTLHEIIKPHIERYWRLYAHTIINDLPHTVAEHQIIINSLGKGDVKATDKAIRTNWEHGADRICQLIQLHGERGAF